MHGFHRECLFETIKVQPTVDPTTVEKISVLDADIKLLKERIIKKKE
jgi:hypothetical protein